MDGYLGEYFDEITGRKALLTTRLGFATSWRETANSRLRREFGQNSTLSKTEPTEEVAERLAQRQKSRELPQKLSYQWSHCDKHLHHSDDKDKDTCTLNSNNT